MNLVELKGLEVFMYRLGLILLSLFTIFMETIIVIVSMQSGFFTVMFLSGGIFLVALMFLLGYFEMRVFGPMEDKLWIDWIFFILCVPSILFTLLLAFFGKCTIEWASSYTPSYPDSKTSGNGKYKVTTDSAGTEIIVDSDGNKVTGVDFVNWDGGVYGTDGKKYDKKG